MAGLEDGLTHCGDTSNKWKELSRGCLQAAQIKFIKSIYFHAGRLNYDSLK